MITVIQATNRPDSNTEFISIHIRQLLREHYDGPVGYVSMMDVPAEILSTRQYKKEELPEKVKLMQDQWMVPAEKFIWILPEYNGSFPGILKFFIDAISVRRYDDTFKLKKSMLVGVATGRSGNIRGMDHLSGILLHMKSVIYPRMLPVSKVSELMDDQGRIHHAPTLKTLEDHIQGFVSF
jgi:chromate reductase, NAD(P)H dehydrogenase (quinone)